MVATRSERTPNREIPPGYGRFRAMTMRWTWFVPS
ncbi:hypothetical protein SAMN02745898_107303 [Streptomyces sp. 136MFCol5.1]|nr:hypothetical protein SAMN02745898_107303 [Streptomyces sp. 136MFCol5.1]